MLSLEAAERGFDFGIGRKFPAIGLCKAIQDGGLMLWIDLLGLLCVNAKSQHCACDLVLTIRREPPYDPKRFFKQFSHR